MICSIFIITLFEVEWITKQQLKFNNLEESYALQLERMIDYGIANIGF